jgi:replicative DNA helicase
LARRASSKFDGSELEEVAYELKNIRKAKKLESPFATLDELANEHTLQHATKIADDLISAIESKDAEKVREALIRSKETVVDRKGREGGKGLLEITKQMIVPKKNANDKGALFVPTGFSYIDKRWRGIKAGELYLTAGVSNVGKSIRALQCGAKAISRSVPVLHVTTEMDADSTAARYTSRFTGVPEEHIREEKLTAAERELLLRWMEHNWHRINRLLHIERILPNEGTIGDIRDAINERTRKGVPPGLLIVDSPDHLRGSGKYRDKRADDTEVYWSLKALASESKCAVLAATQVHKQWAGKIATAEAVADNYERSRIADWFTSINGLKGDDGTERLFYYIGKRRSGTKGILVPMICDLSRMRMDTAPEKDEERSET